MNQRVRLLLLLTSVLLLGSFARAQASKEFDELPIPVKAVPPVYPEQMKKEKVSGIVTVKVVIDANGDVLERTVAKSTRPEFETSALEAVQQWKFKPAKKSGVAVKATVSIPIRFSAVAAAGT